MANKRLRVVLTAGLISAVGWVAGAQGAIVQSNANSIGPNGTQGAADQQFTFDVNILTNDLVNVGAPTLSSRTSTGSTSDGGAGGGTVAGLNDGGASGKTTSAGTNDLSRDTFYTSGNLGGSPTVTFNLNTNAATGGSATGYSLSRINSINGWQDTRSFADQHYTVAISTLTTPAFTDLLTADYAPFAVTGESGTDQPSSTQVTFTDPTGTLTSANGLVTASGVTAIRFTFTQTAAQSGQVIREIDISGSPTLIPEPASLGLLGVGGMMFLRRRGGR